MSGHIISEPSEIVSKFQEYFEELLNNNNSRTGNDNNGKYEEILYHTTEPELPAPNIEEIEITIKSLKNNPTNPTKVSNYRGISLLDTAYKVLSIAILRRIEAIAIDIVGKYQCGFSKGRSTSDHIFMLRQTMEKYYCTTKTYT